MSLQIYNDPNKNLMLLQTQWKSQLDPIINNQTNNFVYTSNSTSLQNGVITDVAGCLIQSLLKGNYSINFGGQLLDAFSVAPTSSRGDFYLRDLNSNQVGDDLSQSLTLLQTGINLASMSSNQLINWPGGLIKLSAQITTSGGTISSRTAFRCWIQAVPI